MSKDVEPEPLVDAAWVGRVLGVSRSTVYEYVARGDGPPAYRLGKHIRFQRADVLQWVADRKVRS
ncbi:helix-turn-helix transcriptional regulator [Cellulosimicrobium sp. CpK407]|uniref:helix-turn-helix transcriptional regulator n=1 Tax=Cellulosimicrobium sp. CpK407 TaxID=3229847 RepID=UPI003F40848B